MFENIHRKDKIGGGTGLVYKDKYNPSLVDSGRLITSKFSQWQIKKGRGTVSGLMLMGCHTQKVIHTWASGFWRLNNIDMLLRNFNLHVEDVRGSENLAFQDILESFGLVQYMDFPTHQ